MRIISHRCYWTNPKEQNSISAFKHALDNGFGVEIDIRDFDQRIVVSHDLPTHESPLFDTYLDLYKEQASTVLLALNIKSDGLQEKLLPLIQAYDINNYVVFDMSVPDLLHYKIKGIPYLIRQSEYEQDLSLITESAGVWLDEFHEEWITRDYVEKIVELGKTCYVVSAELHQKEYMKSWEKWRYIFEDVSWCLCTDFPLEARKFFFEKG